MIQITRLTENDIPLIQSLNLRIWPQTYSSILSREQIDYMLDMMYSEKSLLEQITKLGHQFIMASEAGEPLAFASFSPKSAAKPGVIRLHKIYILPDQQGKGIGRKLIEFIEDRMKTAGAEILELNVNRNNPARSFYEKLGFEIFREEDIDIGQGYYMNDYVMRKRIGNGIS